MTASPAVVGRTVFFAGGKTLYSVQAADGSIIWKHVFCGNPEAPNCEADANDPTQILTSPAVFENLVFIGLDTAGNAYGQPYRGAFVAVDALTGKQVWRFETDPLLNRKGDVVGGENRGCGGVWSSPAVDTTRRLVVFGTSDCNEQPMPPYHGFGPTTLANQVVLSGFTGLGTTDLPAVKAYDARTNAPDGRLLAVFPSRVGGVPGTVNSAVIPVDSSAYFGSGNFFDGGGGGVHALRLPE